MKQNNKPQFFYTGILIGVVLLAGFVWGYAKENIFTGEHVGEITYEGNVCEDTIALCQEAKNGTEICELYCNSEDWEAKNEEENNAYS